jgi:hypothetical protein
MMMVMVDGGMRVVTVQVLSNSSTPKSDLDYPKCNTDKKSKIQLSVKKVIRVGR